MAPWRSHSCESCQGLGELERGSYMPLVSVRGLTRSDPAVLTDLRPLNNIRLYPKARNLLGALHHPETL